MQAMFDEICCWQLHIARQSSAAKGFMGACPQVCTIHPS